jgi:8-oxo-dGTP pyrophosphatase MutT (NUDIX family)
VVVPDGPEPPILNTVPLTPAQPPSSMAGWATLVRAPSRQNSPPPFPKSWKKRAAGAVIFEPDGRVWLYEPTNHYCGYQQTFPKGTVGAGDSFEATAAREAFEETGLLVEIGAFLIDSDRSLSVTRFFLGHRIGGCPSAMGWEAQAVWLVPMADLHTHAASGYDAPVIRAAREAASQAACADGSPS